MVNQDQREVIVPILTTAEKNQRQLTEALNHLADAINQLAQAIVATYWPPTNPCPDPVTGYVHRDPKTGKEIVFDPSEITIVWSVDAQG